MNNYVIVAIDLRTGFPVEATIRNSSAGEAQHEFESAFPRCRVTAISAQ